MQLSPMKTAKVICAVCLKDAGAYGGFIFYVLVAALFMIVGDYVFTYKIAASLIVVTVIVMLLRLAYNKPRPGRTKKNYKIIYEAVDNSSFPSIHMARAVIISIAIFTKAAVLTPLLTLMVVLVAASRLYFRRHDVVDISVGAILGLVLGWIFFLI